MLVRYRYRIDPNAAQRQALARAFGCARVVYNDALAERERAYAAGEQLSDTDLQRRVITLAKCTPQRAWLAEVACAAVGALQRDRDPGPGRALLRLVRGPAPGQPAAAE